MIDGDRNGQLVYPSNNQEQNKYYTIGPLRTTREDEIIALNQSIPGNILHQNQSHTFVLDFNQSYFFVYYNDVYDVPLPPNHRFPMDKYRQVRMKVQDQLHLLSQEEVVTRKEQNRKKVHCEFLVSPLATLDEITTTHCPHYLHRYLQGQMTEHELRNVGFPWSTKGVHRSLSSVGGTIAAATAICEAKRQFILYANSRNDSSITNTTNSSLHFWSAHVAGGTHHAFYDRGEGFCVFSDIAVAANVILQRFPDIVRRILILDLDVHQGNGNAVLFHGRDDVFTFSIHCAANYFSKKEQSRLDVELPAECTDETYLSTLYYWLKRIKTEFGNFDLVFFQAGVDVLKEDRLGRMSLTQKGVQRRNQMVYEWVDRMGALLCITMGGGYPASNDWEPIINAHSRVYIDAYDYLCHPK